VFGATSLKSSNVISPKPATDNFKNELPVCCATVTWSLSLVNVNVSGWPSVSLAVMGKISDLPEGMVLSGMGVMITLGKQRSSRPSTQGRERTRRPVLFPRFRVQRPNQFCVMMGILKKYAHLSLNN